MFIGMVKETSKDKIWSKGPNKSSKGQGNPIQVWFTWSGKISYNTHIPDELRRQLDKKCERCIFTSYNEQHKEYKLYNPITKKVVVSRDIKFIEDKCWSGPSDIHQEERSDMPDLPTKLPRLEVQ